jgi:hypothetical protein
MQEKQLEEKARERKRVNESEKMQLIEANLPAKPKWQHKLIVRLLLIIS